MIHKTLEISTAHLLPSTLNGAERPDALMPTTYGALSWVMTEWDETCTPSDLIDCWNYAASMDCALILFDRDGEKVPNLAVYEW